MQPFSSFLSLVPVARWLCCWKGRPARGHRRTEASQVFRIERARACFNENRAREKRHRDNIFPEISQGVFAPQFKGPCWFLRWGVGESAFPSRCPAGIYTAGKQFLSPLWFQFTALRDTVLETLTCFMKKSLLNSQKIPPKNMQLEDKVSVYNKTHLWFVLLLWHFSHSTFTGSNLGFNVFLNGIWEEWNDDQTQNIVI